MVVSAAGHFHSHTEVRRCMCGKHCKELNIDNRGKKRSVAGCVYLRLVVPREAFQV